MSNTHQQYVSLDTVINMYLDRSEQSIHKYYKCWQIAFSGMEELGLDFFYQIKSVKLPVNSTTGIMGLCQHYMGCQVAHHSWVALK